MTIDQQKFEAAYNRLFQDVAVGYGGVMVSLGARLGLYRALDGAGPLNAHEVAKRAGCAERYVREWLNSQVAAGYVDYHAASRTYELSPEHAAILADETSPAYLPIGWQIVASMWADEEKTLEAFRTGKGVRWGDHDPRMACGVGAFYRNGYKANLVGHWLPALDGVVAKLERGATVADVGCGHGHSTVLMAQAFPASRFWGFDSHDGSIAIAREEARKAGVEDRVVFEVAQADAYPRRGFDLICFFDCLHDMGRPVEAARQAAAALAKDGTLMVIEPFAGDRVEDNISPVGRLFYAGSTTMCCAHAISENGTHVLGAQAGPGQIESVLKAAGFGRIRRAAETPFNLILEARL